MHLARTSGLHWPAGQFLSSMWSRNSCSKKRMADITGPGVSWPSEHSEAACMLAEMYLIVSTSARVPLPSVIRVEDLQQPHAADPAGHALAARLGGGELQEVLGELHHAGVVVDDDHAARAHGRARSGQ